LHQPALPFLPRLTAARRWHPDRNLENTAVATKIFKEISEAYEVLSDKNKRAVFDTYGEEGLKQGGGGPAASAGGGGAGGGGGSGGGGGFPGGFAGFPGGGAGGMRFSPSDPGSVFASFFSSFGGDDGGGGGGGGPFARMGSMPGAGSPFGRAASAAPIKRQLAVSLEELFSGVTKRVKVTRQRGGKPEEKVLEIVVKPGWKVGTAVTFEKEGDETPGGPPPADLVFVIAEKPHALFAREGNNLVYKAKLPLADALCGCTLSVPTLDGRTLSVAVADVVAPGATKTVKGEGMPVSRTPAVRGDLVVKFDVAFPRSLSEEKKRALRATLAAP
jgi:DnaJ family protein B protein 4